MWEQCGGSVAEVARNASDPSTCCPLEAKCSFIRKASIWRCTPGDYFEADYGSPSGDGGGWTPSPGSDGGSPGGSSPGGSSPGGSSPGGSSPGGSSPGGGTVSQPPELPYWPPADPPGPPEPANPPPVPAGTPLSPNRPPRPPNSPRPPRPPRPPLPPGEPNLPPGAFLRICLPHCRLLLVSHC
jgi:hypothetical protein